MSRTYRKSWMSNWYSNLERYENRVARWHFSDSRNTSVGGYRTGMSVETTHKYFSHFRDGWSETARNTGLKEETNRNIRSKTKKCINVLVKDTEAFDDMNFSDKYTEKYLIWNYF